MTYALFRAISNKKEYFTKTSQTFRTLFSAEG